MTNDARPMSTHVEAVVHARAARLSGELAWKHVRSEFTQDVPTVLATLEPGGPYTWTLPNNELHPRRLGLSTTARRPSRRSAAMYEDMRNFVEVVDWEATTEIRSRVVHDHPRRLEVCATSSSDEYLELESITMFPVGARGHPRRGADRRPRRRPGEPLARGPRLRRATCRCRGSAQEVLGPAQHDARRPSATDDVDGDPRRRCDRTSPRRSGATSADEYTRAQRPAVPSELAAYYRGAVRPLPDRRGRASSIASAESWFLFSEVHWVVEHRGGDRAGEVVEFCTADMAPIDPDGKFWVRTGAGTDPVPVG